MTAWQEALAAAWQSEEVGVKPTMIYMTLRHLYLPNFVTVAGQE